MNGLRQAVRLETSSSNIMKPGSLVRICTIKISRSLAKKFSPTDLVEPYVGNKLQEEAMKFRDNE